MKYNVFLLSITSLIFAFLLSVVPAYAVEVGGEVPPNPSTLYYDDGCSYVYGSTIDYNNRSFGSYIAMNREPEFYGTFIAKTVSSSNGHSYLMRSYAFIDVTNNSDYLYQLYNYGLYQTNSMASVGWGDVLDSSYGYNHFITVDNKRYLVVNSNTNVSDDFVVSDVANYYNDTVQFLSDKFWTDLTDRQIFDLCVNFDHPQLIGEYDSSIPCLIRADVSFSNVTIRQTDGLGGNLEPLTQAGQISGIVSPFTNKGPLTSDYVIDYQVLFGMATCRTLPVNQVIATDILTLTKYNGGLSLDIFNQASIDYVTEKYAVGKFFEGSNKLKVSCNVISLNARLRRKSDGAYGDWYSIGVNNLGFNDSSYHVDYDGNYKPLSQGYSGIVSGSVQTILPSADFDDALTSQNAPSTAISVNGTSLGTSESGGVLQQGGIMDLITATGETNYNNILSYLGDVPKLMGVVFGYLPPFFISFITTAFVLLITIGLIKMLV